MTHFSWPIDGSIIGLYIIATMAAGLMVRKYVGKVEHFLVAGREMNLYLGIASLAATEFGVITCMYAAQNGYLYGFSGATPGILAAFAMLIIGVTGFCIKPLRDAGVMTIPELFQVKFGSGVRWLAGVVIVLGGLLNMGVFLRIGGEFLMVVCGLPGNRLEITMTALLVLVAVYTILGGMLSVLVTDFLQFVVMSIGLLVVTIMVLSNVGWNTMAETVEQVHGPGGFNPFLHPEMGWPYVIFFTFVSFAGVLTWQTQIARLLSAKDSRTGQQVYTRTSFFFVCRFLIPGIWGIAALATLTPDIIATLPDELADPGKTALYAMPLYLNMAVPIGLTGLLIAAMLAADMSTDSSYMLTWGSVIYNDILAPFRKNWSERRGLLWNRFIVAGIGVFLLLYGLWYPLKGPVMNYLAITGTVYLSSMSVLLIACCYWRRASSAGAYAAIVVGAVVPMGYLVLEKVWLVTDDMGREIAWIDQHVGPYYSGIAAYVLCAVAMIVGSLLHPNRPASPVMEAQR